MTVRLRPLPRFRQRRPVGPATLGLAVTAALALAGCNAAERASRIGGAPELTPIQNPVAQPGYTPVRMPMPSPQVVERQAASLWQPGARAFFRDQRARNVGDILTVVIAIDDRAQLQNQTQRTRTNAEGAEIPNFLGMEAGLAGNLLPEQFNPSAAVDLSSNSTSAGTGQIQRNEQIRLQLAATVIQVLPNGNLAIHGRQEVLVNNEVRDLQVAGIIRPEDITSSNTINYQQIAEARIRYGGRGTVSDVQQPRYGQQVYDIIFPF